MKATKSGVVAIKVNQWLDTWNKVKFDLKQHRRPFEQGFYIFSLPAKTLRLLCGIQIRTTKGGLPRSKDIGIQRRHDRRRSEEIGRYIRFGYPWSSLSPAQQRSGRFEKLLKPGWLPTAIVVNILKKGDKRTNGEVDKNDLVTVTEANGQTCIELPKNFRDSGWKPAGIYPMEIIDGQHRLWAFEEGQLDGQFDLPVVAFYGLDISWQAYLFWTINIKPKRINASLAYDLYPLLRTEDWLEEAESAFVYREARAQELVAALWSHPESPWYHHINMLGEPGLEQMVSQAAWVRSLTTTFVKSWESRRIPIGGLFGARIGERDEVLPWTGAQQAAFLIFIGQKVSISIKRSKETWASALRSDDTSKSKLDPAFAGQYSLLNTDQGIRPLLHIVNDLCYVRAKELELEAYVVEEGESQSAVEEKDVSDALESLKKHRKIGSFVEDIAENLTSYDWRASSAPSLTADQRALKLVFRGASGYRELRQNCWNTYPSHTENRAQPLEK